VLAVGRAEGKKKKNKKNPHRLQRKKGWTIEKGAQRKSRNWQKK